MLTWLTSFLAEVVGRGMTLEQALNRKAAPHRRKWTNLSDRRIFCDGDFLFVFRGFYCDLNNSSFRCFRCIIVVIPRICGALVSHLYSADGTARVWRQLPDHKRSNVFPERVRSPLPGHLEHKDENVFLFGVMFGEDLDHMDRDHVVLRIVMNIFLT